MAFLYEEFEIHTDLDTSNVYNRVLSVVETKQFWASPLSTAKPYFGEVQSTSFDIRRVKWNSRAIRPVVVGKISSNNKGSYLRVRVRLNWFEFVFYMLVFGLFGHFAFWYFIENLSADTLGWLGRTLSFFIPLTSFSIVYLLIFISVKVEAISAKQFFLELLNKNSNVEFP
ncbi:MAG TPA: hypothetical protein VFQ23_19030 [Anaerolineales bacterium]|nr:hypothetical protein [Anaerolineales bacterium]